MFYYSYLIINFSNILIDGTPLNNVNVDPVIYLRNELEEIDNLEFFGMNSSIVSGEHQSSNLVFIFSYYKYKFCEKFSDVNELVDYIKNKVSTIPYISYSEIRIEFTRTKSLFRDLENERLYRESIVLQNNTSILILFDCVSDLYVQENAEMIINQIKDKLSEIDKFVFRKISLSNSTTLKPTIESGVFCWLCDTEYNYEIHLNNIMYNSNLKLNKNLRDSLRLLIINKLNELPDISNIKVNMYLNDSMISRTEDF